MTDCVYVEPLCTSFFYLESRIAFCTYPNSFTFPGWLDNGSFMAQIKSVNYPLRSVKNIQN